MHILLTLTESQDLNNAPNLSQQNKIKTRREVKIIQIFRAITPNEHKYQEVCVCVCMGKIYEIRSMPLGNPALSQAIHAGSLFNHVRGVIIFKKICLSYIFNPISKVLKSLH